MELELAHHCVRPAAKDEICAVFPGRVLTVLADALADREHENHAEHRVHRRGATRLGSANACF